VEGSSAGRLSRLLGPESFLLFAIAGLFFPWVRTGAGSAAGIEQGDGWPVLAMAAGAFFLARAHVRWAWIPAALGAVVTIKDIFTVSGVEGAGAGIGLWMSAAGLTAAAILLFAREIEGARRARGG
jgi:hypothetical protein